MKTFHHEIQLAPEVRNTTYSLYCFYPFYLFSSRVRLEILMKPDINWQHTFLYSSVPLKSHNVIFCFSTLSVNFATIFIFIHTKMGDCLNKYKNVKKCVRKYRKINGIKIWTLLLAGSLECVNTNAVISDLLKQIIAFLCEPLSSNFKMGKQLDHWLYT